MKEEVVSLVGNRLDNLGVVIDSVYLEEEGNEKYLRVVLDRDEVIPIDTVVMATRIISPLLDDITFVDGSYILDVYAKEKGEIEDER